MDAAKALLGAVAGRFLFRHGRVFDVKPLTAHFTRVDVAGAELLGGDFVPGDKVQVFLPGVGMRTYTPVEWRHDRTWFVGFAHGSGPGSAWLRAVKPEDEVAMMGPRRSIDVRGVTGPLVVVGDETSLAVALALTRAAPERSVMAVLEAGSVEEVSEAARRLELSRLAVYPRGDVESLVRAVKAQVEQGASAVFTGRAATIQALKRAGLKAVKTKAYWAEGKKGLD